MTDPRIRLIEELRDDLKRPHPPVNPWVLVRRLDAILSTPVEKPLDGSECENCGMTWRGKIHEFKSTGVCVVRDATPASESVSPAPRARLIELADSLERGVVPVYETVSGKGRSRDQLILLTIARAIREALGKPRPKNWIPPDEADAGTLLVAESVSREDVEGVQRIGGSVAGNRDTEGNPASASSPAAPSASPDGYVSVGELVEAKKDAWLDGHAQKVLDFLIAKAGEPLACSLQAEHDELSDRLVSLMEALRGIGLACEDWLIEADEQSTVNVVMAIKAEVDRAISQSRESPGE